MSEKEIWAYCYSEKEEVSIAFGTSFDPNEETIDLLDTAWIDEGISDSFWENHHEFEPGIEKAIDLLNKNNSLTIREALFMVFGEFSISYEVDGKETDLSFDVDINECIYSLLAE